MKTEIEILNEWLEKMATKFENDKYFTDYAASHPEFVNTWPGYYRGLKDIHTKQSFTIGSGDHFSSNPLKDYLEKHQSEYNLFPCTGSCSYVKK